MNTVQQPSQSTNYLNIISISNFFNAAIRRTRCSYFQHNHLNILKYLSSLPKPASYRAIRKHLIDMGCSSSYHPINDAIRSLAADCYIKNKTIRQTRYGASKWVITMKGRAFLVSIADQLEEIIQAANIQA